MAADVRRPEVTIEQAQAQVDALNAANFVRFPEFKDILVNAGFHTRVVPLQDDVIRDVKATLVMLWGSALFVLLIGTVNIANIVLARSTKRTRELATRFALGAARAHVARQLLTETVVLTGLSALLGLLLGELGLRAFALFGLNRIPRAGEVGLDGTVVLFALCLAAIAGVAIGLIPALQAFHVNLASVFREDGRAGSGRGARAARTTLAVAQVAIALILLVGAGLLLKSFRQVLAIDPGYRTPERIVTASVTMPSVRYPDAAARRAFVDRALAAFGALPGVEKVGATDSIPFGGSSSDSVIMAEGYEMQPGESLVSPFQVVMTPGYCEAMGITLLQGRLFDGRDTESSQRVVIVDDRLAAKFWPDGSPVGRRMWRSGTPGELLHPDERTRWYTVVGVVHSVKQRALVDAGGPVGTYFFPYAQTPRAGITFAVRASASPSALVSAMRARIAGLDPEMPLFDVKTMDERAQEALRTHRTPMLLSATFGLVALFLAAVGIYGVLAYMVAQRTREIGIRIAVGSTPAAIFRLVLREGLRILVVGFALGLTGALLLGRFVRSLLYNVTPVDPTVLTPAAVLLGIITMAACALPSLRATRIDPAQALRQG